MASPHFLVSVGGRPVTNKFIPVLISASISQALEETADKAQITLDDSSGNIRFPKTGEAVHIELGWQDGAIRKFDGTVDTCTWETSRSGGAALTVTARSISLRSKAMTQKRRHWQDRPLSTILGEAGADAGITMSVSEGLAGVVVPYEMQENESFFAFAERLAREYGAIFRVSGEAGLFVERGVSLSGAALSSITVSKGANLISASGFSPAIDRQRVKARTETWYDLDKAEVQSMTYETGDDVDSEAHAVFHAPDAGAADIRSKAGGKQSMRHKAAGTVVINAAPEAQAGGTAILSGVRAGIDGTYTISALTDELTRGSGYTTSLTLEEPQGTAGTDDR